MKALLVIDMLNEFLYGPDDQMLVPRSKVNKIIKKCRLAIGKARKKGVKIIYIRCYHTKSDPCVKIAGVHCMKGSKGAEIVNQLKPEKTDLVVPKICYDSFYKTRLESILRKHKIKKLYLIGIQTDCCVRATAMSARYRDFDTTVIEDCCDTNSKIRQKTSINFMKFAVCKVAKLKGVKW